MPGLTDSGLWRIIMALDINTDSDAYNTGFAACKAGDNFNPYCPGTWDASHWDAGYKAAE